MFQNIAGVSQLTMDQAWDAARMAGMDADIQRCPWACSPSSARAPPLSPAASGRACNRPSDRLQAAHPALRRSDERPRQPHPGDRERKPQQAEGHPHRHRPSAQHDHQRRPDLVLQAGRIVQSGTYVELMEREGPFRELAARQIA